MIVWLAQGFGIGRIPFAPGTFGSAVGLLWFITLLATKNLWFYLAGTAIGIGLSVWLCGAAERILKQTDPSSIVLDEIVAVPVCFLSWVTREWFRQGQLPALEVFFNSRTWYITLITFALFRLFDIVKPWPIRQSQRLPGGWGVTIDDLLASVYVALLTLMVVR
jgi:phosphatidylglycerophosphatase A